MLIFGLLAFLWLLFTIIPVIFFYFLRMQFRRQPVSSTYIWNKFKDRLSTGNRLKWRTLLLLILQILALIFLILALTKPSFISGTASKPGTCFLLDVSASMGVSESTTEGTVTRLDIAKKMLADEIDKLPDDSPIKVYLCSSDAVLLTDTRENKSGIKIKLKNINVTDKGFKEEGTAATISAWQSIEKKAFNYTMITDGGLEFQGKKLFDAVKSPVKILYVGENRNNIGINGLRLIDQEDDSYNALFYMRNTFDMPKNLGIIFKSGDRIISESTIEVPQGLSKHILEIDEEFQTGSYSIELENNDDAFKADDICYLSVNQEQKIRILVAGKDNPFINAALAYENILFSTTDKFPQGNISSDWDIIISNYVKTPGQANCNLLYFGDIPADASLKYGKTTGGRLVAADTNHPLLRYVDWENTRIAGSLSLIPGSGVSVLSTANNLPVMAAWEQDGYKYAVCTFDIFNSDIGLSGSFPIFLQNFISWCVPGNDSQLKYTIDAGETITRYESSSWESKEKEGITYRHNGSKLVLTGVKSGTYQWESSAGNGTISINIPLSETDIPLKKISQVNIPVISENTTTDRTVPVDKLPLIIFLILIILEWFLWIGIPLFKRRR